MLEDIPKSIKESERKYRTLAENITDVIFVQDMNFSITYISPSVKSVIGYTDKEVIGKHIQKFLTPSSYKKAVENYKKYFPKAIEDENFEIPLMEYEYIKKDGSTLCGEMKVKVLKDENGNPLGSVGIVRDITYRKKLEERLIQAEKMEALGKLVGGIAHNFNNILTVILGYTEIMLKREELSEQMQGMLSEVQRCGERVSELVNQLLSFSKQKTIKPSVVDVNALIIELSDMLKQLIGEHIKLVTDIEPGCFYVRIDPHIFEQIIFNMALNSKDAMPQGGSLLISTRRLSLPSDCPGLYPEVQDGDYVCILFSDTGTGMDEYVKKHIFDPFFTTKGPKIGTGLGLSIVYGVIKQSKGYIYVSSEPDKGTTFTLLFPLMKNTSSVATNKGSSPESERGSGKILVVEDDEGVRKVLSRMLNKYGYQTIEARDGNEALSLIQESDFNSIDLLLTDIVMPGMNGFELAEKITLRLPDIKVLYITGYTDSSPPSQRLKGNQEILRKPFVSELLLEKVKKMIKRSFK